MTGILWWTGVTNSFAARVACYDGVGIDVPVVRSLRRPDACKGNRRIVLAMEPYRRPVAGGALLPLAEAAGGSQAAALPE